jgi:histidinol dehydrogenase
MTHGLVVYSYPEQEQLDELLRRPSMDHAALLDVVKPIMSAVKLEGDEAVKRFTELFDRVALPYVKVEAREILDAEWQVNEELKVAILKAAINIEKFHISQVHDEPIVETMPGVNCWRKNLPIERVGLYIPGGSAPLFSTVLMLGIPAKIAGCKEVVLCTPPDIDGQINPAILFAAQVAGIRDVFKIGGAQAIAAMAYGTKEIPKVDKIFGPGNQYVTAAKQFVQMEGTAIDMPAGPSEVLVIADEGAPAAYVAADLLSQAEHGPDSQVILVTWSEQLLSDVQTELANQLAALPRKEIAEQALRHSKIFLVRNALDAMDLSNAYAPEHLILAVSNPHELANKVLHAGSVFLGYYTPESVGDYASGTNHTLPTNGYARSYSGVSVDSFVKKVTFQQLTREGLENLGPIVETMAAAEQLTAHERAVSIRRE